MTGILRKMNESDLPLVLEWRNLESVRMNMYSYHVISNEEHIRWWAKTSTDPSSFLFVYELSNKPVGVVTFSGYSGGGGSAAWAFYAGDSGVKGVGAQMERAALEFAFEVLKVDRLECEVLSSNYGVVNFHLRHGFLIEGFLRRAYRRNGDYFDIVKLAIVKSEWESKVRSCIGLVVERSPKICVGKQTKVLLVNERPELASDRGDETVLRYNIQKNLYSMDIAADLFGVKTDLMSKALGRKVRIVKCEVHFLVVNTAFSQLELDLSVQCHLPPHMTVKFSCCANNKTVFEGQLDLMEE